MARRLHKVESSFLQTVKDNNLIEHGDRIVVGVSGGPDSTTLLSCLVEFKNKIDFEILVAHVNHLIRKESTDDEKYVENLCKKMSLKYFVKRADVDKLAKEEKRSTEEMGRIVRYAFFDEISEKEGANKIAIAHNMNDNAETMLLNLIRGSGLNGLEGIQAVQYGKYIRPLINCERKDIEDYCKINNLNPKIDATNYENIYTRNIIRNVLLPKIEELNPNIVQTLSRTSVILADTNAYIEDETNRIYNEIAEEKDNAILIPLNKFNILSKCIKTEIIKKAILKLAGNTHNIQKINIDDTIKLAEKRVGKKYIDLNKKIRVEISSNSLLLKGNSSL